MSGAFYEHLMVLGFIAVTLGVDGITNKNLSNSMNNIYLLRTCAAVDLCSSMN